MLFYPPQQQPFLRNANANQVVNMTMDKQMYNIQVDVQTQYIPEQSDPEQDRYVFSYTITIRNEGSVPAKLLTRHWIITNADGKTQEVRGDGVVGEQPHLKPGDGFRYTSGTVLETPVGSMQGSYQMVADDGVNFEAEIAPFTLSMPHTIH
jgi:ApaG protein